METNKSLCNIKLICELSEKLKEDLEYRKAKKEFLDNYYHTLPYLMDHQDKINRQKNMFKKPYITDKEIKRSLMLIRKLALNTYNEKS